MLTIFVRWHVVQAEARPEVSSDRSREVSASHLERENNHVYLAPRRDGSTGSGKRNDPFDASTAEKFTALLTKLQPNYTFHYAPGTYETYGWRFDARKTAGTGCKHFGAGMDRTIIRLVGASNGPADGVVFGSSYNDRADGFKLHNLTIDCNAPAQPKWKQGPARFVAAINTRGSKIHIRRVKVIGFGTNSVGTECFPIFVGSDALAGDFSDNVVEDCIITSSITGNLDGTSLLSVGPFVAGATGTNNVARNNHIDVVGNDFLYSHGPYAQVVERNFIKGCSEGVYTEPPFGGTWRIIVRKNDFISCTTGVSGAAHVGSMVEGYLIEGNRFKDCPTMVSIRGDDNLVHYREIIVRENRFRKSDGAASTARAIHILSTDKAVVMRNIVDSAGSHAIHIRATSPVVGENRTSKGALVDGTD